MSTVNCQLDNAQTQKPITVGDVLSLSCAGDMPAALEKSAQFIWADESSQYTLYVLDVAESTNQNFKLLVTSYRPGQYSNYKLKISDGKTTVETSEVQFAVQSVWPQGEKPEPVPSYGPFYVSIPLWFWLSVAAAFLALGLLVFYFVHRKQQRQKLLNDLDKHMTMLPPHSQFSKDLRLITKNLSPSPITPDQYSEIAKSINEAFRLYLIRELRVPALQFTDRQILAEIKKRHRALYEDLKAEILRGLTELSSAMQNLSKLGYKDCEDLFFLVRATADKIHTNKRAK